MRALQLVLAVVLAMGTADSAAGRQLPSANRPMPVRPAEGGQVTQTSPLQRLARFDAEGMPLVEALERLHRAAGVNLIFSPSKIPAVAVNCSCQTLTVEEALNRMFAHTLLRYEVVDAEIVIVPPNTPQLATPDVSAPIQSSSRIQRLLGSLGLVDAPVKAGAVAGVISGRVTDAVTGQGVSGANLIVEGTSFGAVTGAGGGYRIANVPAGTYRISVVVIGYERATQDITVRDGETASVSFALATKAVPLDELVVTGSMVATRVRELSSPITVISSDEIAKLAITRPDELFRGTVAGAVAYDGGPFNYYSSITMRGRNSIDFDYIKTYIDGVEVTDPLYIATIDPASIERVEILRGPQATTIYGSGASGGVMQIFTKKGQPTARPTLQLKTAAGVIGGRWNNGDAVAQTENSIGVSGGAEQFTYNFGATHTWNDAYVPEGDSRNYSAFGSVRLTQGPFEATVSGRWYRKSFGWPLNPILAEAGFQFFSQPRFQQNHLHQKSLGIDATFRPAANWTHNLTVGFDANNFEMYNTQPRRTHPGDTLYLLAYPPTERLSARYNTSVQLNSDVFSATMVGGIEHTEFTKGGFSTTGAPAPWGDTPGTGATLFHSRYGNTGYFAQGTFGVKDRLFVTTGVRVESSEALGDDYGKAVSPRVGVAYSLTAGSSVDVKTRASWGKGIKTLDPNMKTGSIGAGFRALPNPAIGPEEIVGWDGGLEFQFRERGSLAITYYDQTAKNLVEGVLISADANGVVYQWQNVGRIANRGWELEGELYLRPLPITLRGTFTTMESVMEERAPGYSGDIQIGEKMLQIPEYSGGLTATYTHARGAVSVSATHFGPSLNYDWIDLSGFYSGDLPFRGSMRDYWMDYDGVTKYSLNTSYSLSSALQTYLLVNNLTNNTGQEKDNSNVDMPRSMMIGLRYTY